MPPMIWSRMCSLGDRSIVEKYRYDVVSLEDNYIINFHFKKKIILPL